jgi:glycosyltransferase involved in cell wall biosynthesis
MTFPVVPVKKTDRYAKYRVELDEKLFSHNPLDLIDLWFRCWRLMGPDTSLYNIFLNLEKSTKDSNFARLVHKQMGLYFLRSDFITEAVLCFDRWLYSDVRLLNIEQFEDPCEILDLLDEKLTNIRRQISSDKVRTHDPSNRLRVIHITHGIDHANSVLIKIAQTFALHHDHELINPIFVTLASPNEIAQSPQGIENVRKLRVRGAECVTIPNKVDKFRAIARLSAYLSQFDNGVVISHAPLATFFNHLLISLIPKKPTLGLISGSPNHYFSTRLNHAVSWNSHSQADIPVDCHLVRLQIDGSLYSNGDPSKSPADSLRIPTTAGVVVAAGRALKFDSTIFWDFIKKLVDQTDSTYIVLLGLNGNETFVPSIHRRHERLRFFGWSDNYLSILKLASVFVDTFPSGGGQTILDAMRLGIPVVGFRNNYNKLLKQRDWRPFQEYVPEGYENLFEIELYETAASRIVELLNSESQRKETGNRLSHHYHQNFNNPKKMVSEVEEICMQLHRSDLSP